MQESNNISAYRQSLKERILATAMDAFTHRGIKAVRMDDIAQALQISKRTLYEIYANKEDLLFEGITTYHRQKATAFVAYAEGCSNVMEIILGFYRQKVEESRQINPLFYTDLQKYSKIVEYMREEHNRNHEQFMDFLQRGVDEGYFLPSLNYGIVSRVFDALGHYIMDSHLYTQYTVEELLSNLIFISLRGFCTEKGMQSLDKVLYKQ